MGFVRYAWLGMGLACVIGGKSLEAIVLCFVMSEVINIQLLIQNKDDKKVQ